VREQESWFTAAGREEGVLTKEMRNCERHIFCKSSPFNHIYRISLRIRVPYCSSGTQLCVCGKNFRTRFLFELAQFAQLATGKAFCVPDNSAVYAPTIATNIFKQYACTVRVTTPWRVLRLRMEERRRIWRVPANILNKQSCTAERDGSPAGGLGEVLTTPHRKNVPCYETFTQKASDLE